jgi:ATP-dependent DNA helicase Q1
MTRGESGIIYCFSKKDAETVASELQHWSGDIIKVNIIGLSKLISDWSISRRYY